MGCCWFSMEPRRWCACARLKAATKALERVKDRGVDEEDMGRRLRATLKQSSRALSWRGWEWD